MPKDPMRRFLVQISNTAGGAPHEHTIDAAYWQVGATIDSHEPYRDNLVVFKDHDGKPVFAVRGDLIETITEIRDPQATITSAGDSATWCTCGPHPANTRAPHRPGCPLHTEITEAAA